MVELASQIAGATCEFLLLVGEYDAVEGWRAWEMSSTSAWLSWQCSVGRSAAREQVRVARALREFPQIVVPFREGRLSYSKVRAITRVATEATIDTLIDWGVNATAAQIERIASGRHRSMRASDVRAQQAERSLAWHWDDSGMLVGTFKLPAEQGIRFLQAIEVARDVLPELPDEVAAVEIESAAARRTDGEALPVAPTPLEHMLAVEEAGRPERKTRRAAVDAMMEMAERTVASIATAAVPGSDGAGLPGLGAERFTLVMRTSASAEATKRTSGAELSSEVLLTSGVVALPDAVTRRLSCDCSYALQTDDPNGNPLHLGRKTRRIRGRLARAVHARDGGLCQAPGCHNRTKQIHHIVHWSDGGFTCIENLISLCDRHHWLVHEGGWTITGPQGGWRFHSPDGKVAGAAPRPPAAAPPLPYNDNIARDAVASAWGPDRFSLGTAVYVLHRQDELANAAKVD